MTGLRLAERTRVCGIGVLDELFVWMGAGRPGRFALLVGLAAYVVPAAVGYVTIGGRRFPRSLPCCCTTDTQLMILSASPALPGLLFAVGTGPRLVRAGVQRSIAAATVGLEPAHMMGVIIAVVELMVLFGTGFGAVWILAPRGRVRVPETIVAPTLEFADIGTALGVLLFAFTGTGLFNLVGYPQLVATERGRSRLTFVVSMGTLIPRGRLCMVDPGHRLHANAGRPYRG